MDTAIRKATPADSIAIAGITRTSLGYDCSAEGVKSRIEGLDTRREAVFCAVCGFEVVGYVHAEEYKALYMDTLVNILGLAVKDGFKDRGIGRRLMEEAESFARSIGAVGIRLNSGGSRREAHEFYRHIGFDNEKTQIRFFKGF